MLKVKEDMTGWIMAEHGVPDSKWIVIEQADDYIEKNTGRHRVCWLCECTCEKHTRREVPEHNLRGGHSKSCGCLRVTAAIKNGKSTKKYNNVKLNLQDEHGLYGIGYCLNTGSEFFFDMNDYDTIKEYCWSEHIIRGYHALEAKIPNQSKNTRMHWLLVGKYYDHEDRNPLNNRRYNLRSANNVENAQNRTIQSNNTSGIIGVFWHASKQRWIAVVTINKKRKEIGRFKNKENAIHARLRAEAQYFGEFAPQRHLFKEYGIEDEFMDGDVS